MQVSINGREQKTKLLNDLLTTLKSLEKTIKTLNEKNSFLTKVVVLLAGLSFIASCLQIYYIKWPPSKAENHPKQEISSQKSIPELRNNPSKTHASKAILEEPKNINLPEQKLNNKENFEKKSASTSKSLK
ncbi:MAG: hypothetical protein KAR13_11915 [Desulfobulbaceae bacterium]|nr:hypothetical protein [Desulfobulbaceae bacterium]